MNCEMQWFLVLLRRKYSNLFLCRVNQLEKRFSVAQPSHSFFDSREPLLPPKRASFFQKWDPRYLCIWKRTRDGQSRSRLPRVPSLCLRSGFALGGEEKHKEMRQQRHGTNERSLTYLLIGFSQDSVGGISTWVRDNFVNDFIRKRECNHKKSRIFVTDIPNSRITMIIHWTRIARIWRIFIRVIRAIRVQK